MASQFLNWKLGHAESYPVKTFSGRSGDADRLSDDARYWVWIEDGPHLVAGFRDLSFELIFFSRQEERRARRFVRESPRPFLAAIEMEATEEPVRGHLHLFRGMAPGILDVSPTIVVTPEILQAADLSPDTEGAAQMARRMVLKTPRDTLVAAEVPVLVRRLLDDPDQRSVRVYLEPGKVLTCDLQGPPGEEHLVARDCQSCGRAPGKVKLVAVPGPPSVVLPDASVTGNDLTPFRAQRFELLEAWLGYELADQQVNSALFQSRLEHPLDYAEHVNLPVSEGTFALRISIPTEVRDYWIDPNRPLRSRHMKIGTAAEIRELPISDKKEAKHSTAPLAVTLNSFDITDERVVAIVQSGTVPPTRGRIIAVEDYGDQVQRRRKRQAIDALVQSRTVAPDLLAHLMRPETVTPVGGKGIDYWRRPGMPFRLTGPMRTAVVQAAKAPNLFLVQGPPGTGKTTFIVELVHQVLHRHRNRRVADTEEGKLAGMPRILISSTQNTAVANLRDRFAADTVHVSHIESKRQRSDAGLSNPVAATIAAELRTRLTDSGSFDRYASLRRFSQWVAETMDAFERDGPSDHLIEVLAAFQGEQGKRYLPPSLLEALAAVLDGWRHAAAPDPTCDTESGADPAVVCPVPKDFTAQLSELGKTMDLTMALRLEPIVTEFIRETEAAGARVDDHRHAIAEQWRDRLAQLAAAKKRERISERLARDWRQTAEETLAYLSVLREPQAEPARRPDPVGLAETVTALGEWLTRARDLMQHQIDALAETEEAVLYDWLTALDSEPGNVKAVMDRYSPITAATCQMTGRSDGSTFDMVIVDEAARAGIEALIPMAQGRSIILIGDQKQLPPHLEDQIMEKMDQGLLQSVDLTQGSLFQWLWEHIPAANKISLDMQFRMHEDIGTVVSRVFYEDGPNGIRLRHYYAGERARERAPAFGLCGDHPLVWVDTSDTLGPEGSTGNDGFRYPWPCDETNDYEADIIVQLIKRIDRNQLAAMAATHARPVGVITFYQQQYERIVQKLQETDPDLREHVQTGKVDGFQGQEFPLVILSCVRSNPNGFVGFLRLPNRINVAMSRAQRQLIIVGDRRTLAPTSGRGGSPPFCKIFDMIRDENQPGTIVPSREVLRD